MSIRRRSVQRLLRLPVDRRGGTAIEYGLIVALIVIAMVGALIGLANTTSGLWNNVSNQVSAAH